MARRSRLGRDRRADDRRGRRCRRSEHQGRCLPRARERARSQLRVPRGRQEAKTQRELEHFGYRDGISQPAVVGFTDDPKRGQAPIKAGEFVLGYQGEPAPTGSTARDPVEPATRVAQERVLPRLPPSVAGRPRLPRFRLRSPPCADMTEELFRAKLVGRYPSGVPLVGRNQSQGTPASNDPGLLESDKINDFTYDDDPDGTDVPRAAHIRKTNPRDRSCWTGTMCDGAGSSAAASPSAGRTRATAGTKSLQAADADRGLCFVCYQRSIADQFEHIQAAWMNTDSHPRGRRRHRPAVLTSAGQPLLRRTGRRRKPDPAGRPVGEDDCGGVLLRAVHHGHEALRPRGLTAARRPGDVRVRVAAGPTSTKRRPDRDRT